MAFNFPASPNVNDTYVSGGITYIWDGTTWKAIDSYTETDPVFVASPAQGIASSDISNWDTAYGWGDHSSQGYLTSLGDAAGVTAAKITNWDTAYGWGDHASAGYQTTSGLNTAIDAHLNQTNPTSGYVLSWSGSDYAWISQPVVGTSLQSRTTAQATTSSIADGVSTYATIVASKTYALQKVETSAAAWVTLYTDTTSRSDDSTRNENTDPLPGSGVIADVITTGASVQKITPGTIGWNDDVTPSGNVYLKVVNKSGITQAITVTLTYVQIEN